MLIVDDNIDAAESVAELIRQLGGEVFVAHDGDSGVRLAIAHDPDVVLLDIGMPGLDGYESCRRLRAMEETAFIPILMLTAMGDDEHLARAFEAGVDDYLVKPLKREQLVLRVKRMLERTFGVEQLSAGK